MLRVSYYREVLEVQEEEVTVETIVRLETVQELRITGLAENPCDGVVRMFCQDHQKILSSLLGELGDTKIHESF